MNEIYIYLGKVLFFILLFAVPSMIICGIGWCIENKSKIALWIGRNIYKEDWSK